MRAESDCTIEISNPFEAVTEGIESSFCIQFIGRAAVMVDSNRFIACDNLEVFVEVGVLSILRCLGNPLNCAACVPVFVEGAHDMPVGASEDGVNPVLLGLPEICHNLERRIVILHGFRCRRGAVRDTTIRISADDEPRDAM